MIKKGRNGSIQGNYYDFTMGTLIIACPCIFNVSTDDSKRGSQVQDGK
jgi:hypothetical protein